MAKRSAKSVKLPEGVEHYEINLSKEARQAFEGALVKVGQRLGRPVLAATLMDVLCSTKLLDMALIELDPKIEKYREIEKLRAQVGIHFND